MIGLDIGTSSIKLCSIEKKEGEITGINTCMKEIPDDGGKKNRKKLISRTIAELIKKNKIREKNVIISLNNSDVLVRNVELPLMPEEELKSSIKLQGERLIYADLNEMEIDYSIISKKEKGMEVLFVAAPSVCVNEGMLLAQDAGLNPVVMDIDNFAVTNSFLNFGPVSESGTLILIEIGCRKTCFSILKNGKFNFTKNVDFGGANITNVIADVMKISEKDAEELKKKPDCWNTVGLNMKNILRRSLPDLLEAIYKSVEYCKSRQMIDKVDNMFLTGGTSYLKSLDEFFGEIFGIKTHIWDPLSNIDVPGNKEHGQLMSIGLGLALREINV